MTDDPLSGYYRCCDHCITCWDTGVCADEGAHTFPCDEPGMPECVGNERRP